MPINQDKKKRKALLAGFDSFQRKKSITINPEKQAIVSGFENFQRQKKASKKAISGDTFLSEEQRPQDAIQPLKEESRGIFTQLKEAFTGENLIDPATQDLPEIGEVESDSKLKVLGAMLSATVPQEQANILESNIEGLTQRKDAKGNIIVKFPNGNEAFVNKAGASVTDFRNLAAEAVQFFPASKLAGLGKTFLQKIGLGAVGAGVTQTAKELGQEQIGGEFDASEIALATGAGVLGETIPSVIKGLKQARQAKRIGSEVDAIAETAGSIKQAEEATKATGVELFPAQKTQVPATLEKQAFIATLPTAQRTSIAALKKQNKQAGDAVENLLNDIAKSDVIQTGAEKFRTASQKALEAQKAIRKEKTSTLFNEAFASDVVVDLTPVRNLIKESSKDLPATGEIFKTLKRVGSLIAGKPNLRKLQNAKIEIDQMIAGFGDKSLGNSTKREVIQIKNALLDQMDEASPIFKEARELFASASPAVNELEQSIIGKIAKIDDTQLKSVSKKIFDPEQANVKSVLDSKRVIDAVDPEAWNGLLRVELERRLGGIRAGLRESAGETVENIPAQLNRALFGNQKQTNILLNSVSKEQQKNLRYLQSVLKKAGTGRLGGSQTATREEIKKELRGGVLNFFGKLFTPLESARGGLAGATFDKNVKSLSEALFDTKWQPQLSKIRKINPNTPESARLWTQLINDIENENEAQ